MYYILRKRQLTQQDLHGVLTHEELSNGAKTLYSYLFHKPSGDSISNDSILRDHICVSKAMINNYKRELKGLQLLHENKDGMTNIRFMYLGSLKIGAQTFAEDWKRVSISTD